MIGTQERHRHPVKPVAYFRNDRWMAAAPVVAVAFLAMWTPTDDGPTLCPFALLTGVACPGCGMSRAIAWLVRGEIGMSFRYHPLAPVLAMIVVVAAIWGLGRMRRGWKGPPIALVNFALIGFGVLLVAVWAIRIAAGTLPPV